LAEYKLKISTSSKHTSESSTENQGKTISVIYPVDNPTVILEIRGNKQLADKLKKFIEDNAEPEDWEVY